MAWLWWDDDGPRSNGHRKLDCGGGHVKPVAVVRAYVKYAAPSIDHCTQDALMGDWCTNVTPRKQLHV